MEKVSFKYLNYDCNGYCWKAVEDPRCVLVITHGMAEHASRYNDFGTWCSSHHITAYAFDLIGHGYSRLNETQKVGDLGEKDFCDVIIKNMKEIFNFVQAREPNMPINLLGHSMGSMLSQRYIELYPDDYKRVVLSGTDIGGLKYGFLRFVTSISCLFRGVHGYSKFINALTLDGFDKPFKKENRSLAWLSRNLENIEKYNADSLCGGAYPVVYYRSLAKCLNQARRNVKKIKAEKILLVSGVEDPVSNFGKSPKALNKLYNRKHINSELHLVDNARHETLNEKLEIRKPLYHYIKSFIRD